MPLPASTAPRAIAARQCGLSVAGLSCITNLAAGRARVGLSHQDVLDTGEREFVAIAVVARAPGGPTPCGACRQLLAEYAPELTVFIADDAQPGRVRSFRIGAVLPHAFRRVPR